MNILAWSLMLLSLAIVTYAAGLGWTALKQPQEAKFYRILFTVILIAMPVLAGVTIKAVCPGPGEWMSIECLRGNQPAQDDGFDTTNMGQNLNGGFDE